MVLQATRKITCKLAAARISPLHVIEHYHEWRSGADRGQQFVHCLPEQHLLRIPVKARSIVVRFPILPIHPFIYLGYKRLEWFIDMWMATQVLLLPEVLNNNSAQRLSPKAIGNTTLLRIHVAPNHSPTTMMRFTRCFLCKACLANASLAHQHHTLWMLRFARLHSSMHSMLLTT